MSTTPPNPGSQPFPSDRGVHTAASFRLCPVGTPDCRAFFTEFLNSNPSGANPCALAIVRSMNSQMVNEKVPMSREHYHAAAQSLSEGDRICGFLMKENSHVVNSTATGGPVYKAGKAFHSNVVAPLNQQRSDK